MRNWSRWVVNTLRALITGDAECTEEICAIVGSGLET